VQVRFLYELHTKRSPTHSDTYQMLYQYNWFSWWWARGCSKHVENWYKHMEKNCASSWSFTKNHNKMHGQQNINRCSLYIKVVYVRQANGKWLVTAVRWNNVPLLLRAYLKVNSIVRVKGRIDKMKGYVKMRESMKEKRECWWVVHFTVSLTYGLRMWLHHGCLYYQSCSKK